MFTLLEERSRRLLATLTAVALLAGLSVIGVLAPAQAVAPPATPVITVTPNADVDPSAEATFTVAGTGFVGEGAANGTYVSIGATSVWSGGVAYPATGWLTTVHVPAASIIDGAFTATLDVAAGSFDASTTYQVATSAAHWLSATDRTLDAFAPITIRQPAPVATPVITVTPNADVDPSAKATFTVAGTGFVGAGAASGAYVSIGATSVWNGGVAYPATGWLATVHVPAASIIDGAFTATLDVAAGSFDAPTTYQVATSAAHRLSATDRTLDAFAPITIRKPVPVATPQIQVFAADGVTPLGTTPVALGDTIVVQGSGFDPESNRAPAGSRPPITAGNPAGNYVVFGKFADTWRPSDAAPSTARFVGDQKWALSDSAFALIAPMYQPTVAAQRAVIAPDGTFKTTLTIKKKTDKGSDLAWPDTGSFGVYTYAAGGTTTAAQELKAPVNFVDPATSGPATATTLAISAAPASIVAGDASSLIATVTPASAAGTVEFYSGESLIGSAALSQGVATVATGALAAGGHTYTARFVPSDAAVYAPSATTTGVTVTATAPVDGGTVTPPASAKGQLVWGVKASFSNYITGGAAGTVAVSGGAGTSGNAFTFDQASKDFNGTTGTVGYAGSVRFTGHHGALDLKLSNPKVKVTGPGAGVLVVDVVGKGITGGTVDKAGVEFATLVLGAPTTVDGVTTWSNATATLTAAGSDAFSGFYPAGTALDPVSFTIGADKAPGETPVEQPAAKPVAPLAPGTYSNATVSVPTVLPGGEVTVTGTGFGANTTGIELAVYSVRHVLATGLTADANGTVTATVKLPTNLAAGVHTLSFEAPNGVKSQITITVEAPAVAVKQCVASSVSGATLSWGVKSAFRTYITGPIASGTITTNGVTDSGSTFRWAGGTGKFNTEANAGRVAFGGSVNFSGHGGILNLTLSNVRIQVTSASTGALIADVSSTDMAGTTSNQSGVTVATLSLAGKKSTSGSTVTWTGAPASLTAAGAKAFAGSYVAGEALDPVTFAFPLGATVECDASSGALATTGTDGLGDAALLALAAMTLGLGLVMVRRRQTRTQIG